MATAEPCADKVTAAIVAYDRAQRQGAGLLINHCGRPVRLELLVMALNRDGFPVARLRTTVEVGAARLSVFSADLPFVQSAIMLSGYRTDIAATEPRDNYTQQLTSPTGASGPAPLTSVDAGASAHH